MDGLTFVSKLIDSLAWPFVTLITIILLRKPLLELMLLLRRAKYKDVELEFGDKLEELDDRAENAELPKTSEKPSVTYQDPDEWSFGEYIERLAPISPKVAITEAWRRIEIAVKNASKTFGITGTGNVMKLAEALKSKGKIPLGALNLISDLRVLRNTAVHATEFDITVEEALKYGRLAERIIASIDMSNPTEILRTES